MFSFLPALFRNCEGVSRRDFLRVGALAGLGVSLPMVLASKAAAKESRRTKDINCILIWTLGGTSHHDTFDPKPYLDANDGKPLPIKQPLSFSGKTGGLMKSPWQFRNCGQSGLPISELFPHVARHADDLCIVNSMQTTVPNHPQSFLMLHTGEFRFTRPSVGAWILYGLGSENRDLPGFITINPIPEWGGAQNYSNAFLPAAYQGTRIGDATGSGKPIAVQNLIPTGNSLSSFLQLPFCGSPQITGWAE